MARSRVSILAGTALVAGAGYYLYSAGGDPKAAEKQFEHDIQALRKKEAQSGATAGAKVDAAIAKAGDTAETYAKEATARLNQGADAFDKKVEETAAKTRSGLSSWFGGK